MGRAVSLAGGVSGGLVAMVSFLSGRRDVTSDR